MKIFALSFLLFTHLIFAFDESLIIQCEHDHSEQSSFDKLLEWFSSDEKKIMNAPCKSKVLPTEEEMLEFISGKAAGSGLNQEVHGVKFTKEKKALLEAYQDFVTAKDSFGILNNKEKQKNLQADFKINPDCKKVLCAMEKVWGRDYAIKMLYIKLKHGYNISEIAFSNAARFNPEELDDVLLGLEDIPSHLVPLGRKNQQLIHFERGKTLAIYKGTTLANAAVMIFDPWDKESRPKRQYTVFHEMAHNIGSHLDQMDRSPEWLNMSGWIKKGDDWEKSGIGCFVSEYGKANPWEDYAESMSSYRYNGEVFKSQCPEKYEFLKNNVFKGLEYLSTESCSPIPKEKAARVSEKMILELKKSPAPLAISQEALEKSCQGLFSESPPHDEELSQCLLKIRAEHFSPELEKEYKSKLQEEGIPNTSAHKTILKDSIFKVIQKDHEFKNSQNIAPVKETVQKLIEKSFTDANPQGFSKKEFKADDYKWDIALKTCGKFFLSQEVEKGIDCELQEIIKGDEKFHEWDSGLFPAYRAPGVFSSKALSSLKEQRNKKLIEHLRSQELTKKAISQLVKRIQKDLRYHSINRQLMLYKMENWESMTPAKFCQETYGKASNFLEMMGYSEGEQVPLLYKRCVEAQSKKKRRYAFSDEELKALVDNLR